MLQFNLPISKVFLTTLCIFLTWTATQAQVNNVGIGTTTPDPSAMLDVQSTDQGFLVPRMDQSGENVIASPAQGLLIYNTDVDNNGVGLSAFRYYDGALWNSILGQRSDGVVSLNNLTQNIIDYGATGQSAPSLSTGWRLRTYGTGAYNTGSWGLGVDTNGQWYNVGAGAKHIFRINGIGAVTLSLTENSFFLNSGFAYRMFPSHHRLFANGNEVLRVSGGTTTDHVEITDNDISAYNTSGTRQNLYVNDHLIVLSSGQVRAVGSNGARIEINGQGQSINAVSTANSYSTLHLSEYGNLTWAGGHFSCSKLFIRNELGVYNGNNDNDVTWNPADGSISREGSSRRFKKNIRNAAFDYKSILKLKVKEYHMKEKYGSPELKLGVIAEEAKDLGLNYLVRHNLEGQVDGFHYKKLSLYLLPVLQEQDQIIQNQQKKIEDLEARLERLEAFMAKDD